MYVRMYVQCCLDIYLEQLGACWANLELSLLHILGMYDIMIHLAECIDIVIISTDIYQVEAAMIGTS
jgi:hypothetical protein